MNRLFLLLLIALFNCSFATEMPTMGRQGPPGPPGPPGVLCENCAMFYTENNPIAVQNNAYIQFDKQSSSMGSAIVQLDAETFQINTSGTFLFQFAASSDSINTTLVLEKSLSGTYTPGGVVNSGPTNTQSLFGIPIILNINLGEEFKLKNISGMPINLQSTDTTSAPVTAYLLIQQLS